MKRRLQSQPGLQESLACDDDRAHPAREDRRVWLNTDEAAAYIGCIGKNGLPSRNGFRMWARRHGVVLCRRGRRIVVARRDLDRALGALEQPSKRVVNRVRAEVA